VRVQHEVHGAPGADRAVVGRVPAHQDFVVPQPAAQAGTSLADLKARMGHDSARAAMIYQHATSKAHHKIAAALTEQIEASRQKPPADSLAASGEPENGR